MGTFLHTPCSRDKARTLYQDMVRRSASYINITEQEIENIKLPGLRVYGANEAYRCGVPVELRQTIGNWASAKTADTDTRYHREVLKMVWQMLARKHEDALDTPGIKTPYNLLCKDIGTTPTTPAPRAEQWK